MPLCRRAACSVERMHIPEFFFFSSRRRHTRYIGDWSSEVCSSDLRSLVREPTALYHHEPVADALDLAERSEERRVGKECRSRWSADHSKKKEKKSGDWKKIERQQNYVQDKQASNAEQPH